jgi:hypothetical protein
METGCEQFTEAIELVDGPQHLRAVYSAANSLEKELVEPVCGQFAEPWSVYTVYRNRLCTVYRGNRARGGSAAPAGTQFTEPVRDHFTELVRD